MNILTAQETAALLPYPALADHLRAMLAEKQSGRASAPPRLSVPLTDEGVLLLMPAFDSELTITKMVTVHPHNASQDMPSIQAEVLVLDTTTGRRLLFLDGATVTARRTAALSLLAAQMLAPNPDGPLLVVGAGVQARAHLDAMTQVLGIHKVYISSRNPAHAERLASYACSLALDARAVSCPDDVLTDASMIVTATTSPDPVLSSTLRPDTFVAAVGSYQPDQAELPPELVCNAHLFVDTLEGAQAGAGDLIQACVDWNQVIPLERAISLPRPTSGPIIFKSVGHALWDLAAACLAWHSLKANN